MRTKMMDLDARPAPYTDNNAVIPFEKKVSFDRYMKIAWENSLTNLHYLDFKARFEPHLKSMFRPVELVPMEDGGESPDEERARWARLPRGIYALAQLRRDPGIATGRYETVLLGKRAVAFFSGRVVARKTFFTRLAGSIREYVVN